MSSSPHFTPTADDAKGEKKDGIITIKPKGLNIVWGRDNRYWRLDAEADKGAELVQVSWLEVTGSVNLDKGRQYEICFEVTLRPDAFGWNGCPVFMMAKIGKRGKYSWKRLPPLDSLYGQNNELIPKEGFSISVPNNSEDTQLSFGLYEVWSGKWKGGLVIHKATIKDIGPSPVN